MVSVASTWVTFRGYSDIGAKCECLLARLGHPVRQFSYSSSSSGSSSANESAAKRLEAPPTNAGVGSLASSSDPSSVASDPFPSSLDGAVTSSSLAASISAPLESGTHIPAPSTSPWCCCTMRASVPGGQKAQRMRPSASARRTIPCPYHQRLFERTVIADSDSDTYLRSLRD